MLKEWLWAHRGPTLANAFLVEFERIGYKTVHQVLNLVNISYHTYIIISSFYLPQRIIQKLSECSELSSDFRLNNKNRLFTSFKLKMKCEDGTFTTSVYHKQTFSEVYSHFENLSPSVFNFGTVYTLARGYF